MFYSSMNLKIKSRYFLGSLVLLLTGILCAAFVFTGPKEFDKAREEIMLRKIGHEILLASGDSTSRVLPVKKLTANEYQIRFENEFSFQGDSLIKIVRGSLAADHLADDYIVRVVDCSGTGVVFGYAIFKKEENNVIACTGRRQPKGCYLINLSFQRPTVNIPQKTMLIAGLPLLAFAGLMIARPLRNRKKRKETIALEPDGFTIGHSFFDAKRKQVTAAGITVGLTPKEYKLLLILAASPNTIIERGRIQKEIWEDEGVIVGRSLDVFISKLRKKLEIDSTIRLVNIHGKGYRLEITELA